jgi:hypothetical protein
MRCVRGSQFLPVLTDEVCDQTLSVMGTRTTHAPSVLSSVYPRTSARVRTSTISVSLMR